MGARIWTGRFRLSGFESELEVIHKHHPNMRMVASFPKDFNSVTMAS